MSEALAIKTSPQTNIVKSDNSKKKSTTRKKTRSRRVDENINRTLDTPIYDPEMEKYIYNGIAQNIDFIARKKGLRLTQLSNLSGIHYSHLTKIVEQQQKIGLHALINIAYALDVAPADLFPYDLNSRKTNGERFDDLTKECDLQTVNTILGIVADYVKDVRRIKHIK